MHLYINVLFVYSILFNFVIDLNIIYNFNPVMYEKVNDAIFFTSIFSNNFRTGNGI